MMPCKNGTCCKTLPKGCLPNVELSDFQKGILKSVV